MFAIRPGVCRLLPFAIALVFSLVACSVANPQRVSIPERNPQLALSPCADFPATTFLGMANTADTPEDKAPCHGGAHALALPSLCEPHDALGWAKKHEHLQLVPFAGCHFGNTDTCSDMGWFHRSNGFVWVGRLNSE